MSHRLEPADGHSYLDPQDAARRLQDEFAFCEIDADQGQDDVGDMLVKLIELKAPQAIIDKVIAGRTQSLRVSVADNDSTDDSLSFMIRPDDGILIGYYSGQHEAATRPLLERCAQALGYQIVLV